MAIEAVSAVSDLWPDGLEAAEEPQSLIGNSGVVPDRLLRTLIAKKFVLAEDEDFEADQVQPASLDLRLGRVAYRIRASFLPGRGRTVAERLAEFADHRMDLTGGAVLERGCVYLVPLLEHLSLPDSISAAANPKSSTGRIDVFTRLVVDNAEAFDVVAAGHAGNLYAEIAPRTFSVLVRKGSRLSQLRFRRRNSQQPMAPEFFLADKRLRAIDAALREGGGMGLVDRPASFRDGLVLRVSLAAESAGGIVGYRARRFAPPLDVDAEGVASVADYWEPIAETAARRLTLDPGEFYILASQEAMQVPPDLAAEMVAIDPNMGEFRVHYAGFFDPGFGHGTGSGARAVLEVRSLEIPYVLEHGQAIARMRFEPLAEPATRAYGEGPGSHYQAQGLKLSKHFRSE